MPLTPLKDAPISPAGVDLGLGQDLQNQVDSEVLARRKKQLGLANSPAAAYGALGLGTGLNNGQGLQSASVLALLGQGGFRG